MIIYRETTDDTDRTDLHGFYIRMLVETRFIASENIQFTICASLRRDKSTSLQKDTSVVIS